MRKLLLLFIILASPIFATHEFFDTMYYYTPFYQAVIDSANGETTFVKAGYVQSPYGYFTDSIYSPYAKLDTLHSLKADIAYMTADSLALTDTIVKFEEADSHLYITMADGSIYQCVDTTVKWVEEWVEREIHWEEVWIGDRNEIEVGANLDVTLLKPTQHQATNHRLSPILIEEVILKGGIDSAFIESLKVEIYPAQVFFGGDTSLFRIDTIDISPHYQYHLWKQSIIDSLCAPGINQHYLCGKIEDIAISARGEALKKSWMVYYKNRVNGKYRITGFKAWYRAYYKRRF